MRNDFAKQSLKLISNRIVIFLIIVFIAFSFLVTVLFEIQIVRGEEYYQALTRQIIRTVSIAPERGNIYDRFGRPLAVNSQTHSVMIDLSVNLTSLELNLVLLNFLRLLETNNEQFVDVLPITTTIPFDFAFSSANPTRQRQLFLREMYIQETPEFDEEGNLSEESLLSAREVLDILITNFGIHLIPVEYNVSPVEARNLASLRAAFFPLRFNRFIPLTLANDVGLQTVTIIEEDNSQFRSLFINTDFLRHYPGGHYFSHIVGYIGTIREEDDLTDLEERGYLLTDLIGRSGIEAAFENELRGRRGNEQVYVNNVGRRLGVVENSRVNPVNGSDVFLTIDKNLQIEAYHILRNMLITTIINRMTIERHDEPLLTPAALLSSLVAANNIDPRHIFEESADFPAAHIVNYVLSIDPYADPSTRVGRRMVNQIIAAGIRNYHISATQILLIMYDQGIITGDENFRHRIANTNPQTIIIEKLLTGEITPQMTNVDPSTGTLVVVDVHTGEVLAAVNYPTFDNNQLVNNVNIDYYLRLFDDPTTPLFNRAFHERRQPGSTFKMVTGIAALESGVITPNTRIMDRVRFTSVGYPYPTSWASASLGNLNYAEAIARSSNYFFYESAFRLGALPGGGRAHFSVGIGRLNTYMEALGLNHPTGVEISEAFWHNAPSNISSIELQRFQAEQRGEVTGWTEAYTVRTAIGQALNSYTAASMARLTAGIASRGQVVNLRLLSKIVSEEGVYHAQTVPFDTGVNISASTWTATHEGMRLASEQSNATAFGLFRDLPFSVGAKTGTAEHGMGDHRLSHTTFNAFAPFHDPQIAIYVLIPFGATLTTSPAPSSQVARDVITTYFIIEGEENIPIANNVLLP